MRGLVGDLRKRLADLGPDIVVTTPTGYRLAAGVTTDVTELETTVAKAAGLRATGRWHALLARLGAATALDPGDLAAGLEAAWLDAIERGCRRPCSRRGSSRRRRTASWVTTLRVWRWAGTWWPHIPWTSGYTGL